MIVGIRIRKTGGLVKYKREKITNARIVKESVLLNEPGMEVLEFSVLGQ
jgi:hypothetical protein